MIDRQDLILSAATATYAALLDTYKELWEPEYTWVEVVLGTTMCLAAAAMRVRWMREEKDWTAYERAVWRAFAVGGTPIIAWRIGRAIVGHMQARERDRRETDERTKALAQAGRSRTRADGRAF